VSAVAWLTAGVVPETRLVVGTLGINLGGAGVINGTQICERFYPTSP